MTNTARQNPIAKVAQARAHMRKGASITNDPETMLVKDRIRQIIGEQGYRVYFPGWPERVEIHIGEQGKTKTRSLGKLTDIAQLDEASLASFVLTKLGEEDTSCNKDH